MHLISHDEFSPIELPTNAHVRDINAVLHLLTLEALTPVDAARYAGLFYPLGREWMFVNEAERWSALVLNVSVDAYAPSSYTQARVTMVVKLLVLP